MASLDQVVQQMMAADMPPLPDGHPRVDGRIHRYGRDKKAWYVLHEFAARNGKIVIVGAFGRWLGNDNGKIVVKADFTGVDQDEHQRITLQQMHAEQAERDKRAARARFAAGRAYEQWRAGRAHPAEGEAIPYLARKRLQWEKGLRVFTDGTLLVPMVRYEVSEEQDADPAYTGPRRLAGLQKIKPDGFKLFNKGMDPVGVACRFGRKPKDGDLLLVGEGLATVLTAYQGLERIYTAYVAFVAGNLELIAKQLRKQHPKSPILFLADDDAYLEAQLNKRLRNDYGARDLFKVDEVERVLSSDKHGKVTVRANVYNEDDIPLLTAGITVGDQTRTLILRNTGRTKARAAAMAIGNSWVACPRFAERKLSPDPDSPRLTDFNDLHVSEGLDKAVSQLGADIKLIEDSYELAKALASGATPAAAAGASGGDGDDGGKEDEPDWALHGALVRRFTLINRSGMAWDAALGFMWRIEHLRLTYGGRAVAMWLNSKRRREVDLSRVVFDPVGAEDAKSTVNLFRGLTMKPAVGDCSKTIRLLHYLCGEEGDQNTPIADWVLKWCAYQVRHVGAKMKTAIVMYGAEGTGKNLFWSAMLDIFAPYSALIGQAELEGRFNTWQSQKLMIVANEVVTRAEMTHHVGRLKNLVTEDRIHIEGKFSDVRYEANHVNLVFLSNELQPLKISPGDRRYMIIRTPRALDDKFYREVAAELKAGGKAAFMRYLLEVDLGEFGEHTKPIITEAKRELIEIGMLPSQLFWQEIKDQLIPFPYCPALSDDVYRAYAIWCVRRGHKMPEAQHRFTPAFMSMNGVRRIEKRVPDPEKIHELGLAEDKLRKRRVFCMGEPRVIVHVGADKPVPYETDGEWLVAGLVAFRKALRAYEAEGGGQSYGGSAQAGNRGQEQAF